MCCGLAAGTIPGVLNMGDGGWGTFFPKNHLLRELGEGRCPVCELGEGIHFDFG